MRSVLKKSVGLVATLLAATAMTLAPTTAPAHAATTAIEGSHSCPAGQHVYVSVDLARTGTVTAYRNGSLYSSYANQGGYVIHYYGYRVVSWRVVAPVGIDSHFDGCANDPVR